MIFTFSHRGFKNVFSTFSRCRANVETPEQNEEYEYPEIQNE